MTHSPHTHTPRRVKCIRDGASCARCRRLRKPCIQRMTSTTFVVRDDNGLPLAAVPPGAASLHSSSASIATTASASAAAAAAASASGPLPPPAPPASLSRPAPSVGGAASAALGLGWSHMRGKGEAPPPLSAREELQLLAVVRAFAVFGFVVRMCLVDFLLTRSCHHRVNPHRGRGWRPRRSSAPSCGTRTASGATATCCKWT